MDAIRAAREALAQPRLGTPRARFRGQKPPGMFTTAAGLRTHASWDAETNTTMMAWRSPARRQRELTKEAAEQRKAIPVVVRAWRADLLEELGVGPIVAATVLCAWSHRGRIHSEAAFAMLAAVAPIPASSGQVTNRYHEPTSVYVAHRTTEGKTGRVIKRCLSRYITRDFYRLPASRPATT